MSGVVADEAQRCVPLVRSACIEPQPALPASVPQRRGDRRKPRRFVVGRTPAGEKRPAHAAREARLRSVSVRNFLRSRISFGVTSTSSSSSMKSSAGSRVYLIAGVSLTASSLPYARTLGRSEERGGGTAGGGTGYWRGSTYD